MPNNRDVAIFWDYENCPPPSGSQGYHIAHGIQRIAHVFGSITTFKAYLDMSGQMSKNCIALRSEFQSSGVTIVECPHNGRKDVVDKMILVDMLAFAIGRQQPATIILIAGDRDYAYALSTLRFRRYSVVLIAPQTPNTHPSLQFQASVVIDWNYSILRKPRETDTPPLQQYHHDIDEDTFRRLEQEICGTKEDPTATLRSSFQPIPTAPARTRSISATEPSEPSAFRQNTELCEVVQPPPPCTPKKAPSVSLSPFIEICALPGGSATDDYVSTTNEIQDLPFTGAAVMSPRLETYQNFTESGSPPIPNCLASLSSPATYSLGLSTAPPTTSPSRTISGGTPTPHGDPPKNSVPAAVPSPPATIDGGSDTVTAQESRNDSLSVIMDDFVILSRTAPMQVLGLDDDGSYSHEGSLLVEADDFPLTYVTNAIEPCLDERQASFDDALKFPLVNDASLSLTKPDGTLTSQTSSLCPSVSDSGVTTPNVEMRSQATPVVDDDNTNHSSSECQALPIESVEDRIRRDTPAKFLPLINQLLLERMKGINKPSRSTIADRLNRQAQGIYQITGANKFGKYAILAERASLVELGRRGSDPWISLHSKWFTEDTAQQSPTTSSVHSNSCSAPPNTKDPASSARNVALSTTTASPPASPTPQAITPDPSPAACAVHRPVPFHFCPLITCLVNTQKGGMTKPLCSAVDLVLGSTVYATAGVPSLREYLALAVEAEIVELGGANGSDWVRLHPSMLNGRHSFY